MKDETVTLTLPAKAQYMTLARLAAAAMAGQAGFNVEQIEDVKSAVAEACLMLLPAAGERGAITLELWEDAGLRARISAPGHISLEHLSDEQEFGRFLLQALLDQAELVQTQEHSEYLLYRALD